MRCTIRDESCNPKTGDPYHTRLILLHARFTLVLAAGGLILQSSGTETMMELPLEIAVRNTTVSHDVKRLVREHAARLDRFSDRITACRVLIEVPQRHRIGTPIAYRVRIDLTVPGSEIVVKRQPRDDLLTAVQDAFDAAGRRLQDYARRQRGDVKRRAAPARAVVRRLFPYEGYGFLETPDGREVYFHRNSVVAAGFDALREGSAVRYVEEMGAEGPQASTVTPAGNS
jgi:cold shock CspA family protein